MGIQSEVGVSGNGEVVDRKGVQHLGSLDLCRYGFGSANLCQAIRDKEDEYDEQPIRRALDLEVTEERVRSEQIKRLVNDICLLGIG